MERVLVTGSNGFIASHVIEELHNRGFFVVGLQRSQRDLGEGPHRPDEVYLGDVRDAALVHKIVEQVDGVVHLAAILGTKHVENAWKWYDNNVRGTLNVLDAAREFDTPLVYISVGNFFEHNNYSNSKVSAEREVLKYAKYLGVRANIVRALNAVGPRQKVKNTGKIMSTFSTLAIENKPLKVYGGKENCSKMDLVYVGDVAKVLVDVLVKTANNELAPAQKFEAGTGKAPTVYEIAEWVIEAAGSSSQIEEVPMREGETPGSVVVAEDPYPIEYKDIKEVIKETVEFYRQELSK